MTSRIGRPIADLGISLNGSGRVASSTTAPQTLTEKLKQEFGQHGSTSGRSGGVLMAAPARPLALPGVPQLADQSAGQLAARPRSLSEIADEDDERMPIPSTWRAPPEPTRTGWLGKQIRAGLLGLVLGLTGVVPTVLWLTGKLGEQITALRSDVSGDFSSGMPQQVSTRSVATVDVSPVLLNPPKPALRSEPPVVTEKESSDVADELLSRALGLIDDGEVMRAREVLGDKLLVDNPKATFALAETFDPNILAATGVRGVKSEVEHARMLYSKALAGGIAAAQKRLDALR